MRPLEEMSAEEILARIGDAGIVGMGGAGFPAKVKLSPREPEKIDYILSDGSFRRLDLCAWHADGNGRCLSDHDGLMARVEA